MPTSPHVPVGLLADEVPFGAELLEQVLAADAPDSGDADSDAETVLAGSAAGALRYSQSDHVSPEAAADLRALDRLLAKMMHRASATIGQSHLYFSEENLRALGDPTEATDIAEEIEQKTRGLILRAEVPHTQRYMAWSGYLRAAALAAGRAAHLFDLLQRDQALAPVQASLRRVGDAAQRVLLYAATSLTTAETRPLASVARYQAEMAEACAKANEALDNVRTLEPLPAERMTRAAIWSLSITADCAATVAQQYTEVLVERRVREAHRAHTAAKFSAANARKAISLLREDGWSLDARPLRVNDADRGADRPEDAAVLRPTPPPSAI
ncbi:MAG TPA: hypothetical protein VM490_16510, partial [Armatimonadaceae bacterium]|nr:hypothetical protein [Armatimonadaceae bacterium]